MITATISNFVCQMMSSALPFDELSTSDDTSSNPDWIGPELHGALVPIPDIYPSWILTSPYDIIRSVIEFLHERDVLSLFLSHPNFVHECDMILRIGNVRCQQGDRALWQIASKTQPHVHVHTKNLVPKHILHAR